MRLQQGAKRKPGPLPNVADKASSSSSSSFSSSFSSSSSVQNVAKEEVGQKNFSSSSISKRNT